MGGTYRFLSLVAGALSVVSLSMLALETGSLIAPLQSMLQLYERIVHIFLGAAEPFIRTQLSALQSYLEIDLHLYPHWKHFLILSGIYFSRSVGAALRIKYYGTAAFKAILGLVIGLATSVGAGTIPAIQGDFQSNFLIAAIPLVGTAIYGIAYNGWQAVTGDIISNLPNDVRSDFDMRKDYFLDQFAQNLSRTILASIILVVGLQIPAVRQLPSPGLALFGLLIVGLALWWLLIGRRDFGEYQVRVQRNLQEPDSTMSYWTMPDTRLGLAMLEVFFGAVLFFALNAGLSRLGIS